MAVAAVHGFQVGYRTEVESIHGFQVGYGAVESVHGFQVGYQTEVESVHGFQVSYLISDAYDVWVAPKKGDPPSLIPVGSLGETRMFRRYGVRVFVADQELECSSVNITERWGQPTTWNVEVPDPDRIYAPGETGSLPFIGDAWTDSGVKKESRIEITSAGKTWTSPVLLQTEYDYELTTDQARMSLSGTDLTDPLLQGNRSLGVYTSTDTNPVYASEILGEIAALINVKIRQEFDDYLVGEISLTGGTPMSWIAQLCQIPQALPYWDGKTLVLKQRRAGASGTYKVIDEYDIIRGSYKRSGRELKTEFVVASTKRAGTVLAKYDREDYGILGFHTISLSQPSKLALVKILEAREGYVDTYNWYDEEGNSLDVFFPWYSGAKPAASVRFIYYPRATLFQWPAFVKPRVSAVVFGGDFVANPSLLHQADSDRIRVTDGALSAIWGVRRDAPLETALIANLDTARAAANNLLAESKRTLNLLNFDAVLNPFIRPATVIDVEFEWFGISSNWWVESISKTIDSSSAKMGLELTQVL